MEKYNLTEGNILSRILLVAVPVMGTQFIQMLYNLTDMFWLGKLSSDFVAATGTAGMYLWLSMAFLMFGRMGAEIGVSQNLGRGDEGSARKFSQDAFSIAVCLGMIYFFITLFFSRELISFFGIKEHAVAEEAARYLRITGLGCPMTFISAAMQGTFNGAGNSRISFIANATGLTVNIILDPLLIFILKMGVTGAAISTTIGQGVVMVIFLIAIKKSKGRPFEKYNFVSRPSKDAIMQIIKWSLPVAAESLFFTILSMFITKFVSGFGSGAIAVQRVSSQIESLSWLIAGGYGSAVTAFIGQNYGAGKWKRIRECSEISIKAMLVWGVIITCILFFCGEYIFSLFLSDEYLKEMGRVCLKIFAVCQMLACLEALASGAMRGIGKTLPPSLISILSNGLRVPLAYYLSKTVLGINGIWWGVSIGSIIRGGVTFIVYLIILRKQPKNDMAYISS